MTREEIKARMHDENIRYVLTQFVDLNGSPKAKMVPADHLDDVLDVGAGFAGAAWVKVPTPTTCWRELTWIPTLPCHGPRA